MTADAVALGIPSLDARLARMPAGSAVAVAHEPGVEAEPFLYQAAAHHVAEGRPVVYAVFDRSPEAVAKAMLSHGFDPSGIDFLDAYTPLLGLASGAAAWVLDGGDLAALPALLARVSAERPGAVLVVDPLSALADRTSPRDLAAALPGLREAMRGFSLVVALFARWPYEEGDGELLAPFEAVVGLRAVRDRVTFGQYFTVERAAWTGPAAPRPVLYKVVRPGGVLAFVPKVLVTGPFHSGKSTFVQTVSDAAVSVNRLGTTVALDHGRVTLDGLLVDVFGTPGQSRFDPILAPLAGQALGVVLVVDATDAESLPRALDMMSQVGKAGLPVVVVANKQDAPGAMAPSEVARRLRLPPRVRVVGCVASDRDLCRAVLRDLVRTIMASEPPAGATP